MDSRDVGSVAATVELTARSQQATPGMVQVGVDLTVQPNASQTQLGRVAVAIVDDLGRPVPGLIVEGSFSGAVDSHQVQITGPDGVAVFESSAFSGDQPLFFDVVSVTPDDAGGQAPDGSTDPDGMGTTPDPEEGTDGMGTTPDPEEGTDGMGTTPDPEPGDEDEGMGTTPGGEEEEDGMGTTPDSGMGIVPDSDDGMGTTPDPGDGMGTTPGG